MSTHTSGPWIVCPGNAREHYNIECKGSGNGLESIATCKGPDRLENARLIAAAPELLEWLSYIAGAARQISSGDSKAHLLGVLQSIETRARAAIAKATLNA